MLCRDVADVDHDPLDIRVGQQIRQDHFQPTNAIGKNNPMLNASWLIGARRKDLQFLASPNTVVNVYEIKALSTNQICRLKAKNTTDGLSRVHDTSNSVNDDRSIPGVLYQFAKAFFAVTNRIQCAYAIRDIARRGDDPTHQPVPSDIPCFCCQIAS